MARGKILLTGGTGFIGSAILVDILKAGYAVNIVVRSESKAKQIQQAPAIAALDTASACKYFIVPDLTVQGSLDEAAAGTDFVIHCASPLPFRTENAEEDLIAPAVRCTLRALEGAKKAGTVKRVVVLSSIGAFVSPDLALGTYVPPREIFVGEKLNEDMEPPFPNPVIAYCAAKTAALKQSIKWMEAAVAEGSVNFDLINLAPCYVFGVHPLANSVADLWATSNSMILPVILPNTDKQPKPQTLCGGVLVDDLVETVHRSMDLDGVKTPGSGPSKHIATCVQSARFEWNDVFPIISRKWPEEVKKGILAGEGDYPTKPNINFSMDEFTKTYGNFKLRGIGDILDAVIPHYLELLGKDKSVATTV